MKPADDEAVAASAAEQGVLSEAATAVEQPCVVGAAPVTATKWQAFTRITAVQQALVLFVGSVAYDAGSVAYVGPVSGASKDAPQSRPLTLSGGFAHGECVLPPSQRTLRHRPRPRLARNEADACRGACIYWSLHPQGAVPHSHANTHRRPCAWRPT